MGIPSKKARMELLSFISQEVEEDRMVGFWLYNLPPLLKSTYSTGLKLEETDSSILVCTNSPEKVSV